MNHRGIWLTAAVLSVVVLLAQAAGAATREMPASVAASTSVSAQVTNTAATVTLPEQASTVAVEKTKSHDSETAATETTTTNEVTTNAPAAAPKDSTGAAGTRPGWGCGDKNHTHSGPPGRPNATPPPGCTRP